MTFIMIIFLDFQLPWNYFTQVFVFYYKSYNTISIHDATPNKNKITRRQSNSTN